MLEALMTRSNYADLAKQTNGIGAAFSTAFLFTRLWARSTQYKGLWWDDYLLTAAWVFQLVGNGLSAAAPSWGFNIHNGAERGWTLTLGSLSFWYLSMAFAKTAFAATMLRLSTGGVKVTMWILVIVIWAFSITLTVVTWLDICEERLEVSLTSVCVPMVAVIWIHTGNAIATIFEDVALACMPWYVLAKIYVPTKEKWGVACSMSLTGLAAVVCIVRTYMMAHTQTLSEKRLDYSYGLFICYGLFQAEITIYIVAQTVPLLRVLYLGGGRKDSRQVTSVAEIDPSNNKSSQGHERTTRVLETPRQPSIELVQLPSGKIVAADSEEGRQHTASPPGPSTHADTVQDRTAITPEREEGELDTAQRASAVSIDDKVHKLWADMGLSRRAWSLSPESSPPTEITRRRQV